MGLNLLPVRPSTSIALGVVNPQHWVSGILPEGSPGEGRTVHPAPKSFTVKCAKVLGNYDTSTAGLHSMFMKPVTGKVKVLRHFGRMVIVDAAVNR